ncbi:hypothetical protein GALL_400070 [mine drainage metagenome]|uniref:Uncharacterized protein n=1 Tax=mine drainage metagenome TaxID=410659 RepID=A0A1J5QE46_9ZZZZ
MRAAPAKNLIWSSIGGTSSEWVSAKGLPVFSLSMATNSSTLDSKASAIFSRAFWRSLGVASRHWSKAAEAASIAVSTSAWSEIGAVA